MRALNTSTFGGGIKWTRAVEDLRGRTSAPNIFKSVAGILKTDPKELARLVISAYATQSQNSLILLQTIPTLDNNLFSIYSHQIYLLSVEAALLACSFISILTPELQPRASEAEIGLRINQKIHPSRPKLTKL